ncbi:ABC transporter ATP-binding protein [Neoactinobaculum massilliense]|uniref:ABC transporter ATP-binding protein n=1 Tax=Neoactinobaculum massilliense TaxID=2364794 RepID=UPI000F54B150|nr:ABC transporter ATP-binding protein [Neoactinobaculum massilliense]
MANLAVHTKELSKKYGAHTVVSNLNLHVPTGSTYGFIGSNGAGKTTTIRILLGLAAATSGSATVLGVERGKLPPTPIPGVAYLPDVPDLNPRLRPAEALVFLAELAGTPVEVARERAGKLLSVVGLAHAPGPVGSFSRGMKQRLGIAAALVGAPSLLILDEPTSALDPLGRADVLSLIRDLHGHTTIMFTSHLLGDVQAVCDTIGMIHEGRLLVEGSLESVLDSYHGAEATVRIRTAPANVAMVRDDAAALLRSHGIEGRIDVEPSSLQSVYEHMSRGERNAH